jgi:hypothetical protein
VSAPQTHIYPPQSTWSDQDDLPRFAYDASGSYAFPSDEQPFGTIDTFSPGDPASQSADYLLSGTLVDEEPLRSRPPTRGEYPAYIPDCQETIPGQSYAIDPAAISGPSRVDLMPEIKSPSDQVVTEEDTSRTSTPSPIAPRQQLPVGENSKASSIIQTYKNGVLPPVKRRGKLPKATTELLKTWLYDHTQHPYPTEEEKRQLCAITGLTLNQVSNWMINVSRFPFMSVTRASRSLLGSETDITSQKYCHLGIAQVNLAQGNNTFPFEFNDVFECAVSTTRASSQR